MYALNMCKTEQNLTVWYGSFSTVGLEFRRHRSSGGVAIAPCQTLFILAVRQVGGAGDVGLSVLAEEGASLGGEEGGVLCGSGGGSGSLNDRRADSTEVWVILLLRELRKSDEILVELSFKFKLTGSGRRRVVHSSDRP